MMKGLYIGLIFAFLIMNPQETLIQYVEEISEMYCFMPEYIEAIIEQESNWDAEAESSCGAIGLMQIMPKWHKDRMKRLGVEDLTDAYSNILIGCDYLSELNAMYEHPDKALMVYNEGWNGAKRYDEGIVSNYVKAINARADELAIEHGKREDMSTLYELTDDYMRLLEMANDPDIDEEALIDTFEAIDGEIEAKADGYAKINKEIESDIDKISAEIARLQAKKKTLENSSSRLKKALELAMRTTGKMKFKTDLFSFSIQKNPASLKIDEGFMVELAPEEFKTYSAPTLNKKAIIEAIKNGQEFDFCHMEQSESLRIR